MIALVGGVIVIEREGYRLFPSRAPVATPTPSEELVVQVNGVSVLRSPTTRSQVVATLERGAVIRVTDSYDGWRRVVFPEDSSETVGWVDGSALDSEPAARVTPPSRQTTPEAAPSATFPSPELPSAFEVTPALPLPRDRRWGDRYWGLNRPADDELSPPEGDWNRVIEWLGDDDAETETFDVPTDNWRLAWRAWGSGQLVVELHEASSGEISARFEVEAQDGTAYFQVESAGAYFVQVHPEGVAWRLAVEAIR